MNIFLVSKDPIKAAQSLTDVHVRKMVVESAQLLSVAYSEARLAEPSVPRSQNGEPRKHFNSQHPCCLWTVSSLKNWQWVLKHAQALAREYQFRFAKKHFSETFIEWCSRHPPTLPSLGLTPPHLAMPSQYKEKDFVRAYRMYYKNDKKTDKRGRDIYKWTKRSKPTWA